jgi:cytochrome c
MRRLLLVLLAAMPVANFANEIIRDFSPQVLAQNLEDPMEMSIAADGRIFLVERAGTVRLVPAAGGEARVVLQLIVDAATLPSSKGKGDKESGLLGIALAPDFATSRWLYLYYTKPGGDEPIHKHQLSRFTFDDAKGVIDPASEKLLLDVPSVRSGRIHEAGSLGFDAAGNLYLSTGDNQMRSEYLFSLQSAANTNDLRGKILRIHPEPDGSYTIPEGNLFAPGMEKTRPEIYIMGLRNPFRLAVDKPTGWLLWGENGPPNYFAQNTTIKDKSLLVNGYDEFNIAKSAGFHGYPMFLGPNEAFTDYDHAAKTIRERFDVNAPRNRHPQNTGLELLPSPTPPAIWYAGADVKEFAALGSGGESAIGGPIYHFNADLDAPGKLPQSFDMCWFIGEYSRRWVKAVQLSPDGQVGEIREFLPRLTLGRPVNIKFGPDGCVYVLYYGSGGTSKIGRNGHLLRISYKPGDIANPLVWRTIIEDPKLQFAGLDTKHPGVAAMRKSDCFSCHFGEVRSLAPAFSEVRKKYPATAETVELLAAKVLQGGTGVWGQTPMPPHPTLKPKDIAQMVEGLLGMPYKRAPKEDRKAQREARKKKDGEKGN